jgi:signal transduction histidine kinase
MDRSIPPANIAAHAPDFGALFHHGPLGLAIAQDADCRTVLSNAAMAGLVPAGLAWLDGPAGAGALFFRGQPVPWPELPLRRAAVTGIDVDPIELELRLPGAAPRLLLFRAIALLDGQGRPGGALCVVVDASARPAAGDELAEQLQREQAARRTLETDSRAKDDFIAALGHELRGPLNTIATAVQVLDRAEASAAVAKSAREIIANQTRQLARLVDAVLDIGRAMADDVPLMLQPVDLAALVQRSMECVEAERRAKQQRFRCTVDPARVQADSQRLQQVVEQLLSNAVRATAEQGWIDVELIVEGTSASLRVRDNGGAQIEPAAVIDTPSASDPRSLARPGGRLGIGMGLVRKLIDRHGGRVSSERQGASTTVTLVLPTVGPPPA